MWFGKRTILAGKTDPDRDPNTIYMERWYLLPPNGSIGLFVHKIYLSDIPFAHDHPWDWATLILKGGYIEQTADGKKTWYGPGSFRFRKGEFEHRLELPEGKTCWSLFFHFKPRKMWKFTTCLNPSWEDRREELNAYVQTVQGD